MSETDIETEQPLGENPRLLGGDVPSEHTVRKSRSGLGRRLLIGASGLTVLTLTYFMGASSSESNEGDQQPSVEAYDTEESPSESQEASNVDTEDEAEGEASTKVQDDANEELGLLVTPENALDMAAEHGLAALPPIEALPTPIDASERLERRIMLDSFREHTEPVLMTATNPEELMDRYITNLNCAYNNPDLDTQFACIEYFTGDFSSGLSNVWVDSTLNNREADSVSPFPIVNDFFYRGSIRELDFVGGASMHDPLTTAVEITAEEFYSNTGSSTPSLIRTRFTRMDFTDSATNQTTEIWGATSRTGDLYS